MNNFSNYYNNPQSDRAFVAEISQRVAANMAATGSSSIPLLNSNLRPIMPLGTPTMFGQAQGLIGAFSPELALLSEQLANPFFQSFLPTDATNFINTLMRSPPLGGTADPAGFMMGQLASNIGRGIPRVNLPFDFTNMQATDSYIAQRQAFNQYMGQLGTAGLSPTSIQALQFGQNTENLNRLIAFRNALNMRNEDSGFNNVFALTNSAFGSPKGNISALLAASSSIKDEAAASRFYMANKEAIDKTLENARYTSGLIQGADFLSQFVGSNSLETAEMQSLGDFLFDVLNIGNNAQTFMPGVARALGNFGGLSVAMAAGANSAGQISNIPIANIIAGRLNDGLNNKNSIFSGFRDLRFKRGGELISSLSQSGLIDFGGADIYGSLSSTDVDKMSQAIMTQIEGFSKIVQVGRRAQLGVQEVIQGLNAAYGGALTQEINLKANANLVNMKSTAAPGGRSLASAAITTENARRAKEGLPLLVAGSPEAEQFLAAEAQRMAGTEVANSFSDLINIGKQAGIDARGSLAVAQTVNQILENIGMAPGSGGTMIAQQAMALVAESRARGMPITVAQGIATASTAIQSATRDPNALNYSALRRAAEIDPALLNDPAYQAAVRAFEQGKGLASSAVNGILTSAGFNQQTIRSIRSDAEYFLPRYAEGITRGFNAGPLGPMAAISRALGSNSSAIISKIDTYAKGQGTNKESVFATIFELGATGNIEAMTELAKNAGLSPDEVRQLVTEATGNISFGGVSGQPAVPALASALRSISGSGGAMAFSKAQTKLSNIFADLAKADSAPGEQMQAAIDKARADKVNRVFEQLRKDPANAGKTDAQLREEAEGKSDLDLSEFLQAVGGISPTRALEYVNKARQKIGKAKSAEDYTILGMLSSFEAQYTQQAAADALSAESSAKAAAAKDNAKVKENESQADVEGSKDKSKSKTVSAVPIEQSLSSIDKNLQTFMELVRQGQIKVVIA